MLAGLGPLGLLSQQRAASLSLFPLSGSQQHGPWHPVHGTFMAARIC
jgi:hypothetical protein